MDARFASRPHTAARLHAIADLMDDAIARGATADEAGEIALAQLRALGGDLLTDWARTRHDESLAAARAQHPDAIKDSKKKLKWFTTFGPVEIEEQLLRRGRRGAQLRPFCQSARVRPRGYSRRLQRVVSAPRN